MRGDTRGEEEAVRRTEADGRRDVRREAVVGRGAGFSGATAAGAGAGAAVACGGVGVVVAAGGVGEGERFRARGSACCSCGCAVCEVGGCSCCGVGWREESGGFVSVAEMGVCGVDFSRRSSSS